MKIIAKKESASARIHRWRKDPISFVKENFKVDPDAWQRKALTAFASGDVQAQRIAMKSCKGPGKTALLAWVIWNFLGCYGEVHEHPKGKVTGITEQNLEDNLWPELAKWQDRSSYLSGAFTWTKRRIFANDHPKTWFISMQAWPKSGDQQAQANTLAGLHGKFVLFVIDEAGGVPSAVEVTAEAGLANAEMDGGWAKIVIAGNPTHLEGALYDACVTDSHLWTVIEITGDPDDPDRSPRIGLVYARQQIEKYGRDNPWVLVNIFGKFPPASINALLGPEEVEAAQKRVLKDDQWNWAQKRIGVDVARFGDDRTVIQKRQGLNCSFPPIILRHQRTTDIAARVLKEMREFGAEVVIVDDTGHWGHGVIDNLVAHGVNAIGIQFHGPAIDERYKNRRVEGWMEMAEAVKNGLALHRDPQLKAELVTPTYTFAGGKMVLEDKEQIKDRLGRSPDEGDAIALTFMLPELPEMQVSMTATGSYEFHRGMSSAVPHDYDPLDFNERDL